MSIHSVSLITFFIRTIFIKIAPFFKQFEPYRPVSNEKYFNYLSFETDLASVAQTVQK